MLSGDMDRFTAAFLAIATVWQVNAAAQAAAGIEQVAWLAGCWQSTSTATSRVVEDHWLVPRAGTMLGVGRTVQGAKLIEYELVLIKEQDGKLAYEAHPSGQAAAVFVSRTVGEQHVVFENATHDFPQRVGYTRTGDALLAWIEGTRNGQVRRVEFRYARTGCGEK
jgi:hypothetical protein